MNTLKEVIGFAKEKLHLDLDYKADFKFIENDIDFFGKQIYFTSNELNSENLLHLTNALYYNSQAGEVIISAKKDFLKIQSSVLGEENAGKLSQGSNPYIQIWDGETTVYESIEDVLDLEISPGKKVSDVLEDATFEVQGAVLLNKETVLKNEYLKLQGTYMNQALVNKNHLTAFNLWFKEKLSENELFDINIGEEVYSLLNENQQAINIYLNLKNIEESNGPLSSLVSLGFTNKKSDDYLLKLFNEINQEGIDSKILLADKNGDKLFCVYESENKVQAIRNFNLLSISYLTTDEFNDSLMSGNLTLNDLVISGRPLEGLELFEKTKEEYLEKKFSTLEFNNLYSISKQRFNTAVNIFNQLIKFMNIKPTRENYNSLKTQMFKGLIQTRDNLHDSLGYLIFRESLVPNISELDFVREKSSIKEYIKTSTDSNSKLLYQKMDLFSNPANLTIKNINDYLVIINKIMQVKDAKTQGNVSSNLETKIPETGNLNEKKIEKQVSKFEDSKTDLPLAVRMINKGKETNEREEENEK